MMGRFWSVCVVLSTLGMVGFSLTPSSFLSTVDKQRLQKVFADSLATDSANRYPEQAKRSWPRAGLSFGHFHENSRRKKLKPKSKTN